MDGVDDADPGPWWRPASRRYLALLGMPALGVVLAVTWLLASDPAAPCADEDGCLTVEELRRGSVLEESYHLLDRSTEPLADVGGASRRWVPLERLSPWVPQAWVAVEDRRFRSHGGVDLRGALRAARANLVRGGLAEGASTIPMQLVRVLWPHEVGEMGPWRRKLLEARMAPHLVSTLGRDRTLELYLNGIYLGDGVYGVGAAARHYFDTSPDSLSTAQVATLVAMTKTPGRFDPREHPDRALRRRNVVLGILTREGVLDEAEARRALDAPLETAPRDDRSRSRSYVTAAVRRELGRIQPELVGRPGLTIHTTVDAAAQSALDSVADAWLREVGDRMDPPDESGDPTLQLAAVAMESASGEILALRGGRDFATTELNRALQSRRPVGSLAKPLLLAAALEQGRSVTTPLSTDTLSRVDGDQVWRPRDHVTEEHLLPQAMVSSSSNRAAVRLGEEVGVGSFASLVRTLGVDEPVPPYPSSFLGAFEASLAEMTGAFATLENGGLRVRPHLIRKVVGPEGRVLWEAPPGGGGTRVLGETTAHLVLDAMRDVVDHGTGWRVRRSVSGLSAGKTGTTDEGADAWFVGVRPGIAAGIWMGFDRPASMGDDATGGRLAAPLWGRWMAALQPAGWGTGSWTAPPRLARVPVSVQARGDSVVGCMGGDGRRRLIQEHALRTLPPCRRAHQGGGPGPGVPPRWDPSGFVDPGSIRLLSPDTARVPDPR